jgi:hypothetical protein
MAPLYLTSRKGFIMRRFACLAFAAAAFTCAATPLFAQEEISAVQVRGVQPIYKLQEHQVKSIAGLYQLDNGSVFRLTASHQHLLAQLDDRTTVRLVQTGENRFMSSDQRMTVVYEPQAFGDIVMLSYPQDLARLDSPMVQVRLAAN